MRCLPLWQFVFFFSTVQAANWAQATGKVKQNVVIPKMPTPTNRHWQGRYGTLVIVASNDLETGQLYLMGGDTNDGDTDSSEVNKKQFTWSNGYKNDVWRTTGTQWQVISDIRLESKFKEKVPRVKSQMTWTQVSVGTIPTPGITYDEWLSCQPVFRYKLPNPSICNSEEWQYQVQWAPRRHHAGVHFKGYLWVMGGRARELEPLSEIRSVGGIMTPRIADIYRERIGINFLQKFSTQRETSGYKSDVWRSVDGSKWELVSPGCRAPQFNLVALGNADEARAGIEQFRCETNEDCYSPAEECRIVVGAHKTCVCKMWSPREQHTVSAYGDHMYVVGGFASRLFSDLSNCGPYACGDTDAGSYRYYAQDVWRSSDGETWTPMTLGTVDSFPGRGGHQTIVLPDINGVLNKAQLVVFGGEGGVPETNEVYYYNDIWAAYVDNPGVWRRLQAKTVPWTPRTGHTVTLEPASAANMNKRIVFMAGGKTANGITDEVWSWRPDVLNDTWKLDYTPEALFRSASGLSAQEGELYSNNSPSIYYVTPDSNLSMLIKFWVPTQDNSELRRKGTRPELRTYLEDVRIQQLNAVGLYTIRDLANAGKYDILKLRGYDVPQVPLDQRYDFYDICDVRALAIAVVDKCTVKEKKYYDGEQNMPWNNEIKFGGPPPVSMAAEWHNRNYSEMIETIDPIQMVEEWDGCQKLPLETLPNVNGLGKVSQVDSIRNPRPELQELHCKVNPGPRAYHAAAFFKERFYIFGGRHSENVYNSDSWYRDDRMPTVNIRQKPSTNTPDSVFKFAADEAGCVFEYRIWNPYAFKELRRWTSVVKKADVDWLDWRKGGPGNGRYMLYVRAVDPAGNRDETFQLGRNVYVWNYVSPTPYDIILGSLAAFLFLCFLGYLEYRRRVKKAAMERYAMKRMRRKFKAMQRDMDGRAVDWRTLYQESKEQREKEGVDGKDKAREQKKKRDKAKEAREKEKEKREKEKEKIRKKLKERDKKRPAIGSTGVRGDDWALESDKGGKSKATSEAGDTKKSKRKGKGGQDLFDDKEKASGAGSTVSKRNKRFKEYEQSSDTTESRIKKL